MLGGLPNPDRAILGIDKLRDYCLNSQHSEGRHKARVFASALGLTQQDAERLRTAILGALPLAPAIKRGTTVFGDRFSADIDVERHDRCATVRTCWIIRVDEDVPRLVTCFVL